MVQTVALKAEMSVETPMPDTCQRKSIRDSFMYKHGFSLILGLLAILIVITTSAIIIKQKTNSVTDMYVSSVTKAHTDIQLEIADLKARVEELSGRIRKLERKQHTEK